MSKRLFDIFLSVVGLVVLAPVFLVIAVAIKLESRGPAFFSGKRVGQGGRVFDMYKFRTMVDAPDYVGSRVSPRNDPRVTRLGRFLRRTKLNELPQLFNVVAGDMGFVGPRPEDPDIVKTYTPEQREVLNIRPGIVGPNQILGRNEEDMYPPGVDPLPFYMEQILPAKMEVDLEYVSRSSFLGDLAYLIHGVWVTVTGVISRGHSFQKLSQVVLMLVDITCMCLSMFIAHIILADVEFTFSSGWSHAPLILTVICIRMTVASAMGFYNVLIRYLDTRDLAKVVWGASLGSWLGIAATFPFSPTPTWTESLLIDWPVCAMMLVSVRIVAVLLRSRARRRLASAVRHVLILGAGHTGELALRCLESEDGQSIEIVGFLDDAPELRHQRILGYSILGDRHDLEVLARLYHVDELVIATGEELPVQQLRRLTERCRRIGIRTRMFHSPLASAVGALQIGTVREVGLADWIGYEPVPVDWAPVGGVVAGRRVMITAAGSAVGSQLAQYLAILGVERLILLDRHEVGLSDTVVSLRALRTGCPIHASITSISAATRFDHLLNQFRPDIILHSEFIRPSPFVRPSIEEAARTNVLAVAGLLEAAQRCDVGRVVILTSDLRDRSDWLTDITMRLAEMKLRSMASSRFQAYAVRHVNVLEHRAGPIRVFEDALRRGEVVSLAGLPAQQWCLPATEAAKLVLATLPLAEPGAIYRLDAGKEFDVHTLMAEAAQLAGLPPGVVPPEQPVDATEQSWLPRQGTSVVEETVRKTALSSLSEIVPDERDTADIEDEIRILSSLHAEPYDLSSLASQRSGSGGGNREYAEQERELG